MIQFDFNYKEWRTLKERLTKIPEEILDLTSQGAVKHSKDYLNSRIDWNRNRLVPSIKPNKIDESRVEIHATGKPATYEKYVHNGRGSFSAKNKLALHWIDKSGNDGQESIGSRRRRKMPRDSGCAVPLAEGRENLLCARECRHCGPG